MTEAMVHLIDDDEAIRDALGWLFKSRSIATGQWASAEDFLADYNNHMSGCIVLDIRMEGMNGLTCFEQLRSRECSMPVIFLTGHGDVPMAVAALRQGAYHFIEKPFNDNELVDVVIGAMDMHARHRASQALEAGVQARLETLTPREREVMDLILEGRLNKQIADDLDISMRTVEVHRARIFDKMGVRSAVDLSQLLAHYKPGQ
ncbi:response regulator transcription factor [Uliginosibacterium sp. H1]|uniref:response regulator transcription factor n=1 Tax=Uliginosibacterium sp. H1 TaxID=3114757 RepID=UPI002E1712F2|nr:response regulator [Uliginosibacterium sp. H1]